jgi:putative oxidoreductase
MLKRVVKTDDRVEAPILRVSLGGVMFVHGAAKAVGWFGGPGMEGALRIFDAWWSVPPVLAVPVILIEFLGSAILIVGLLTRPVAVALAATMIGAVVIVHWEHGFYIDWFGSQNGHGYEYHALAIGMAASLAIAGGGRWSIDGWLARRRT